MILREWFYEMISRRQFYVSCVKIHFYAAYIHTICGHGTSVVEFKKAGYVTVVERVFYWIKLPLILKKLSRRAATTIDSLGRV